MCLTLSCLNDRFVSFGNEKGVSHVGEFYRVVELTQGWSVTNLTSCYALGYIYIFIIISRCNNVYVKQLFPTLTKDNVMVNGRTPAGRREGE